MAKLRYTSLKATRSGIIDVWNAFMLVGAEYDIYDVPICPTTARQIPKQLISWPEAKRLHKNAIKCGDKDYFIPAFIHFYVDDVKFDGVRSSIWLFPWNAYEIIRHYDGIITPDFSICQDFPEPLKLFAVYRMRAFGYWIGAMGVNVINNVRWGTRETWDYCFAGIKAGTVVAIGPVASGLREKRNRPVFEEGILEMVAKLKPTAILVYGSSKYNVFDNLRRMGIKIYQFKSEKSIAFSKEASYE